MSTYGTAFVLDVPGSFAPPVPDMVRRSARQGFRTVAPDGWHRTVAYLDDIELVDELLAWLQTTTGGRLAVAEDNDDFGALWVVARAVGGKVETVHRRYVLNADPADSDEVADALAELDQDPRTLDQAGPAAAEAAAALFGVDPGRVIRAERDSGSAWEEIGTIGGPFPWWSALELPWPHEEDTDALRW